MSEQVNKADQAMDVAARFVEELQALPENVRREVWNLVDEIYCSKCRQRRVDGRRCFCSAYYDD